MDTTTVVSIIFNAITVLAVGLIGLFKIVKKSSCASKCFSCDIETQEQQIAKYVVEARDVLKSGGETAHALVYLDSALNILKRRGSLV